MPLSRRVPDLASLDLLLSVARTGSLGGAAREHGVTQQAASLRIRRLETQLGVPVVTRTRRGSTLTAAGVLVADWAGQLTELAAGLDTSVSALRQDRSARLRVAASLTVAEYLMPRWLVTLQRGTPGGVAVQLTATNSEEVAERVLDGRADLGFVEGPVVPASLRSVQVGADSLLLVVLPGHPWARRRRPVTPAEVAGTPLVVREAGSGTRRALEVALEAVGGGSCAPPSLELSGTAAVRGAVLAGAGPAVLSSLAVQDDVASGRLRVVPIAGLQLGRRLLAVWPQGAAASGTGLTGPAADLLALATPTPTPPTPHTPPPHSAVIMQSVAIRSCNSAPSP